LKEKEKSVLLERVVAEPIGEEYWLDQSVRTGWRWSENIGLLLRGF